MKIFVALIAITMLLSCTGCYNVSDIMDSIIEPERDEYQAPVQETEPEGSFRIVSGNEEDYFRMEISRITFENGTYWIHVGGSSEALENGILSWGRKDYAYTIKGNIITLTYEFYDPLVIQVN